MTLFNAKPSASTATSAYDYAASSAAAAVYADASYAVWAEQNLPLYSQISKFMFDLLLSTKKI